ncbi:MAG: arylsulfatase [Planctomycetota bacterium]
MKMKYQVIVVLLLQALLVLPATAETQVRPNVVVILTDDQGWGDLSCHGNTNLETPHLDSLARDGASFDSFFVCQVCAPTRAEFFTGRYHPKTGVSGVSRGQERLNPDETTIADLFKKAGYATGAFGKWHNGTQSPLHPNDRGFDEFYGFTSGHWGHYFSPPLDHNGEWTRGEGFLVDDLTNHAIDFVRQNRSRPFFCYLPLNTPHSPMMVPDRFYEKFDGAKLDLQHRDPDKEDVMMTRAALAMVENIDWNVGRLLETLDALNLAENTIVVFFSDNGPNSFRWNGGMKGRKGSIDEGGLRSPLFVRWPGKIKSGQRVKPIAGAIDLLLTLTDLANIDDTTNKPVDGISLAPLMLGEDVTLSDRILFSIRRDQVSVRNQRFRLDANGRLFDMELDRGQTRDVSRDHSRVAETLRRQAAKYRSEMQQAFQSNADRPFHVGYSRSTILPARDGVAHGTIERSSKAPNNSFFENWTSDDDSVTWEVDVAEGGIFEAIVRYTCTSADVGVTIACNCESGSGSSSTSAKVTEVFDPPMYDKSKERVEKSHYFVKDFKPLSLGTLELGGGRATLRLTASDFQGNEAIDVHSIRLVRQK